MELILWRHAEAEPGEPDLERRLTSKGIKHAARMGQWLERNLPDSCRVLVSPARRAQQTAMPLGRGFRTVAELAPGASAADVLSAANWPDSREAVLVVGHQPTLGRVASLLISGSEREWSIRKGGVWWLSNRDREGSAIVRLRVVIGPDFV
jgi:phosphohistidine phosphatase